MSFFCATANAAAPASQSSKTLFERWYQIRLGGAPSGWMRDTEIQQPAQGGAAPTIDSRQEMHFRVKRGEDALTFVLISDFVETADGKPLTASTSQQFGAAPMVQELIFKPTGIELVSSSMGQRQTQMLGDLEPKGQTWFTPAAEQRYIQAQIAKGAKTIHYWALDPSEGKNLVETTVKYVGPAKVEVTGKVVPAGIWDEIDSSMPGAATREFLDDQGEPVKATMSLLPGMSMEAVEADRDLATMEVNPPELLASTLVTPDRAIDQARRLRSAVYDVLIEPAEAGAGGATGPGGEAWTLPSLGVQRVLSSPPSDGKGKPAGEQTVRLLVDSDKPLSADQEGKEPQYMQASMMINWRDPKIQDLLKQALADQPAGLAPAKKAEVLRRFVYQFIQTKDLAVGLATAGEVARMAEGDCKAHAMLLAALLRAAGIPSRTVAGLVYVDRYLGKDSVFGYHMWAEAWLNQPATSGVAAGHWVDLDATLDPDAPFDATHIALDSSAFADDRMGNDLVRMVPLLGRLKIRVVETQP